MTSPGERGQAAAEWRDAWPIVLAGAVAKHADDHTAAFAYYEAARRERTAAIVARSIQTRQ